MSAFIIYGGVVLVSLGGVALNLLSLPGNWGMMVAVAGLSWATGWTRPPVWVLGAMLLVLLAAESVDLMGSVMGARKFGASRAATWVAMGGAIVGAIVGMPVWIIGNIVGAIIGAFVGAWSVELIKRRGIKAATWAAVGAALGRTMGIATKLTCGLAVWAAVVWWGWP